MDKIWDFLKSKVCSFYIILVSVFTFFYSYITCAPVFYTQGEESARNIAMLLFSLEYIIVAYFLTKPSFTFKSFKKDDGNQMGKTRKSTNELMDEFKFRSVFEKVVLFMPSTAFPALILAFHIVIYSFYFNISIDFILGRFFYSIREENIKKRMKELAETLGKILGKKNEISKCIECCDLKSEENDFEKILN